MSFPRRTKITSNIILIILFLIFGSIAFQVFFNFSKKNSETKFKGDVASAPGRAHIHHIEGFQYRSRIAGKDILAIDAEQFDISRKKLRFLSFGLLNEALFRKAVVRVYDYTPPAGASSGGQLPDNSGWQSSFNKIPLLEKSRITSVSFTPIEITTFMDGNFTSSIQAELAQYDTRQNVIRLEGNVSIVSGDKRLTANRMDFDPATRRIHIDQGYVLTTGRKRFRGTRVTTDLMLNAKFWNREG